MREHPFIRPLPSVQYNLTSFVPPITPVQHCTESPGLFLGLLSPMKWSGCCIWRILGPGGLAQRRPATRLLRIRLRGGETGEHGYIFWPNREEFEGGLEKGKGKGGKRRKK